MLAKDTVITGRRAISRSYAKINLTLDVLSKRADGYHDIKMIMQTVSLFDLILVDRIRDRRISIATNLRYLPNNDKNIAYKAADAFLNKTGLDGGVKIMIHKNIPVAAGLAGGSGNCAAVLTAINMLYGNALSDQELKTLGASLGADVPYCFNGGTQIAEGIGEKLTRLTAIPDAYILLVKPPINVSTASIYEQIDSAPISVRPDTKAMEQALCENNIHGVADNLCNVMESVTEKMYPIIGGIKHKMMLNGALGAIMSGSGPTVFGIFDDYKTAKASADSFSLQFKDVFLTQTKN
ncbi:MAG: 4-(cytidine 5'-diphospho)-2-C-methyl-D-erythritol kinase [Clostridia bacterium]|jgi:4-diphosphocytidyl-2-C-methyl-D-erythritol kinase|nr:4-(cytidine 5'-diphospho)-2-C-methyl-D-erythritol kinase [Clostridia bacterium]MCI9085967.1 4-(cytidine 5'-diphospho)-2-C-methyl-D-erythritol kinase [Clostridia bacterium]NDO18233.1 4-(cytidine 5'-diphospho)-2-C-methyl-D-erythritol kinase [Lachnospiraceae bacterium MD329]